MKQKSTFNIHIIFRACDKVLAVNKGPRPFGLSKLELIKICFKSLYFSAQKVTHTLTVLGDKLSPELKSFFLEYTTNIIEGNFGNDESIRKALRIGLDIKNVDDWVYFCEDDYLHKPETFTFISNLIKKDIGIFEDNFFNKVGILKRKIVYPSIVIFPSDYPDRYLERDRTRHFIFHTNDCHWRQVANITFTFIIQVKELQKHQHIFTKSAQNANDAYLSKMLFGINNFKKKLLCLSPIPSLTAHFHINTLPPLIDWETLLKANT